MQRIGCRLRQRAPLRHHLHRRMLAKSVVHQLGQDMRHVQRLMAPQRARREPGLVRGRSCLPPCPRRAAALRSRFDRIFTRRTGYLVLDRLLARLRRRKAELLHVLERPEIPLHTNASENDIRVCVTKRKVSAGPSARMAGPLATCCSA
ncbi:MAG TPA: transposase [Falsiroseomonas sp.]|nr:transposase [Falsiroseomonas sp.]